MKPASFVSAVVLAALLVSAPAGRGMETLRQYLPSAETTPPPPTAPTATAPDASPAPAAQTDTTPLPPVVRVNVASQSFNFSQPWRKNPPVLRQGLGVVLVDGRILVTAELVNNHTYVELEKPETALKAAAQVEVVDYDANLALLAAPAADFLQSIGGARLDETAAVGDQVEILQLDNGITPKLTLDYQDFTVILTQERLEEISQPVCQ